MEPENYNPYEQQLLSEYESCLEAGQTCLTKKGLKSLCDKLELEERGKELISALLEQAHSISFEEFRKGLVNFLNESRENEASPRRSKISGDSSLPPGMLDSQFSPEVPEGSVEKIKSYSNGSWAGITAKSAGLSQNSVDESTVISKQSLEQLFQSLDENRDGLITFDEFLLFFQNGRNIAVNQLDSDWDEKPLDESTCSKNTLTMFGPDHMGFIQKRVVLNLWQLAGVSEPACLLHDLNFPNVNINMTELMSVLNEELQSLQHEPRDSAITSTHLNLLRGTLVLYQEEVRSINTMIDQLSRERDKLRVDVLEANERANLLAQEIDENHAKLEKSRQDQIKQLEIKHLELIKDLTNQFNCDRESQVIKIKYLNDQLINLQLEEQQVRAKLAEALKENQTLEVENQNLSEQISKLKMSNNQLLMQVQVLSAEHDEADRNDERENLEIISLVERIKSLQAETALLRDQNDELTTELEVMKSRVVDNKVKRLPMSTSFSDSEESTSVTDYEPLDKQVPELKSSEKSPDIDCQLSYLPNTIASIINDLKNLTLDRKTMSCTSDCSLRRNVSEIIAELESQVLETSSEKTNSPTKTNSNKEEECEERLSESLRDFVVSRSNKPRLSASFSHSDEVINSPEVVTKLRTSSLRDYPPRRGESSPAESKEEKNSPGKTSEDGTDLTEIRRERDRLSAQLLEQETKHLSEKKQLQEQCTKLEADLESLRTEYYQCEDYWAGKLEEERQLIEQEQKVTDDKLAELIAKIAEYEEQFSINDKGRNDSRLSPIEEQCNLEQQYTDLEEQYEELKSQTQEIIAEKENQLLELNEKLAQAKTLKVDFQVQFPELDDKFMKKFPAAAVNYALPSELSSAIANSAYYGLNQKLFEPGKLNKIAEHTISDHKALPPRFISPECSCQDEFLRLQKADVQRMLPKKAYNTSVECNSSLLKQKECLVREIMELQSIKSTHAYGQVSKDDVNVMKDLMGKLQALEKKKKTLQVNLKHQKQVTEKVLEYTWKQHCNEFANLQHVLKETQDLLKHQINVNAMLMDKLTKSDILLKDLYIENAHLKQKVENLGERCHVLTHLSSQSTSV